MTRNILAMGPKKKIALVAHDNKKNDLLEWTKFNRDRLARELDLNINRLRSGPLGGDQ